MAATQRLRGQAVERHVPHRRRPDRLDVRRGSASSRSPSSCTRAAAARASGTTRPTRSSAARRGATATPCCTSWARPAAPTRPSAAAPARLDCGPFFDDLEIDRGWRVDPDGTDDARAMARWAARRPGRRRASSWDRPSPGPGVLVTGARQRRGRGWRHGRRVRSPLIRVPGGGRRHAPPALLARPVAPMPAPTTACGPPRGRGRRSRWPTLLDVLRRRPAPRAGLARPVGAAAPGGLGGQRVAIELVAVDAAPTRPSRPASTRCA